ncbi:hypothetical protein BFJ63_vAg3390 [Fusarium oxysporum f. sp. narcissi]|uniref:Uncharacterized protein n=1 Tax=Fusarium oxysporum f. sp. narcissi TaxID=451672 RepID=A0A4Q2W2E5_FUSOX|nr:hypothetical protein BFJ63_vAg3390 [Fusarium oxysporum f. sp. narcissi]
MCAFCPPTLNEHDYQATPCATYVSYRKNHAVSKKIPSIPPASLSTDFLVKCILDAYALHVLVHVFNMVQHTTLEDEDMPCTVPWVVDKDWEICDYEVVAVDDKRHISLNKDEGLDKDPRSVEHHHFTVLAWRPKKDGVETLPFLDREGNILPISGHNLEDLQVSVGKIATHPFSSDSSKYILQQENAELKEILREETINDLDNRFHETNDREELSERVWILSCKACQLIRKNHEPKRVSSLSI